MNWEAIGAIGEIIGATAVVVSLLYLAGQIRTQNRQNRTAAMHEISMGFRDAIATFANIGNAEIITKANNDFESLSDAEVFVLISGVQRVLRVWEEAYFQQLQGNLDRHIWDPMVTQYQSYMSMPAMSQVWLIRKQYFNPDFAQFVEKLVKTEFINR